MTLLFATSINKTGQGLFAGTSRFASTWLNFPPPQDKVISPMLPKRTIFGPSCPLNQAWLCLEGCSIAGDRAMLWGHQQQNQHTKPTARATSALLGKQKDKGESWGPTGRICHHSWAHSHKATWAQSPDSSQTFDRFASVLAKNLVHREWSALPRFLWQEPPGDAWRGQISQSQERRQQHNKVVLLKQQQLQSALWLAFPETFPFKCSPPTTGNLPLTKRNNLCSVSWLCFDKEKRVELSSGKTWSSFPLSFCPSN